MKRALGESWALPALDDTNRAFFTSGVLTLQRCRSCAHLQHPPEEVCERCQGQAFDPFESAGLGRIESAVVVHHPVHPALAGQGAYAIVLEAMPAALAKRITEQLTIPTIGIGAGPHCDGQVLVLHDLLGLFDEFLPKFVKPYAHLKADALQALRRYKEEVEQGKFPSESESYY